MKTTTLLTLTVLALVVSGCQSSVGRWYASQDWTPDSFGYENYRDKHGNQDTHGFGLNWNLKPDDKK